MDSSGNSTVALSGTIRLALGMFNQALQSYYGTCFTLFGHFCFCLVMLILLYKASKSCIFFSILECNILNNILTRNGEHSFISIAVTALASLVER